MELEPLVPPERPHLSSKPSHKLPGRIPLRMEQSATHQEISKVPVRKAEKSTSPYSAKFQSLAIPNGVPMTAASWETGQPHYTGDRKLHAANTFAGSQSFPFTNNVSRGILTLTRFEPEGRFQLIGNEVITSPIYQKAADGNIVSSIFSQSQARSGAIPTMVQVNRDTHWFTKTKIQFQTSQPQAYLEKFLTDGASLDQFSKLAKNLLGVGGGNGEVRTIKDL